MKAHVLAVEKDRKENSSYILVLSVQDDTNCAMKLLAVGKQIEVSSASESPEQNIKLGDPKISTMRMAISSYCNKLHKQHNACSAEFSGSPDSPLLPIIDRLASDIRTCDVLQRILDEYSLQK